MKKYFLLAAAMLLLATTSCDPEKEESDGITRSEEMISSFFNAQTAEGESILTDFFSPSCKDSCCLINSSVELQCLYAGDKKLPEIDFDKYMLLIGKKLVPAGYAEEERTIKVKDDSIVVTLILKSTLSEGEGAVAAMIPYYFWGLHDKLPEKEVACNYQLIR